MQVVQVHLAHETVPRLKGTGTYGLHNRNKCALRSPLDLISTLSNYQNFPLHPSHPSFNMHWLEALVR